MIPSPMKCSHLWAGAEQVLQDQNPTSGWKGIANAGLEGKLSRAGGCIQPACSLVLSGSWGPGVSFRAGGSL